MPPRATHLIAQLGLQPHPEGGFYAEIVRSTATVAPADGRPARAALTVIYFLLPEGAHSALHRVASDEVWHFVEGAPLDLHVVGADLRAHLLHRLGPLDDGATPVALVSAGAWQAARSCGAYTLVACSVAPGFAFEDFALLRHLPDVAAHLTEAHPALAGFL